jgi:zinc transporter ZupT
LHSGFISFVSFGISTTIDFALAYAIVFLDLPEETSDFIELPRGCQCWEMAFLIKLLKF